MNLMLRRFSLVVVATIASHAALAEPMRSPGSRSALDYIITNSDLGGEGRLKSYEKLTKIIEQLRSTKRFSIKIDEDFSRDMRQLKTLSDYTFTATGIAFGLGAGSWLSRRLALGLARPISTISGQSPSVATAGVQRSLSLLGPFAGAAIGDLAAFILDESFMNSEIASVAEAARAHIENSINIYLRIQTNNTRKVISDLPESERLSYVRQLMTELSSKALVEDDPDIRTFYEKLSVSVANLSLTDAELFTIINRRAKAESVAALERPVKDVDSPKASADSARAASKIFELLAHAATSAGRKNLMLHELVSDAVIQIKQTMSGEKDFDTASAISWLSVAREVNKEAHATVLALHKLGMRDRTVLELQKAITRFDGAMQFISGAIVASSFTPGSLIGAMAMVQGLAALIHPGNGGSQDANFTYLAMIHRDIYEIRKQLERLEGKLDQSIRDIASLREQMIDAFERAEEMQRERQTELLQFMRYNRYALLDSCLALNVLLGSTVRSNGKTATAARVPGMYVGRAGPPSVLEEYARRCELSITAHFSVPTSEYFRRSDEGSLDRYFREMVLREVGQRQLIGVVSSFQLQRYILAVAGVRDVRDAVLLWRRARAGLLGDAVVGDSAVLSVESLSRSDRVDVPLVRSVSFEVVAAVPAIVSRLPTGRVDETAVRDRRRVAMADALGSIALSISGAIGDQSMIAGLGAVPLFVARYQKAGTELRAVDQKLEGLREDARRNIESPGHRDWRSAIDSETNRRAVALAELLEMDGLLAEHDQFRSNVEKFVIFDLAMEVAEVERTDLDRLAGTLGNITYAAIIASASGDRWFDGVSWHDARSIVDGASMWAWQRKSDSRSRWMPSEEECRMVLGAAGTFQFRRGIAAVCERYRSRGAAGSQRWGAMLGGLEVNRKVSTWKLDVSEDVDALRDAYMLSRVLGELLVTDVDEGGQVYQ